jgi:hypothetical protein
VQHVSGLPVADARVSLRSWAAPKAGEGDETLATSALPGAHTAADGSFELRGLPTGRLTLEIERDGWPVLRPPEVEIVAGTVIELGTLVLPDGHRLDGTVLDADGAPVPDADVMLLGRGFLSTRIAARMRTDAAGRFALEGLQPAVEQELEAHAAGNARASLKVTIPSASHVTLRLEAGRLLALRVLGPEGAPVPEGEAQVFDALRAVARVAIRDGEARLPAEEGEALLVVAPGSAPWVGGVPEDSPAGGMQVQLARESGVRGVVRDEAGRSLPGLLVSAVPKDTALKAVQFEASDISDGDGRFELRGLREGAWSLQGERAGLVPGRQGLELAAGAVLDVELVLASGGRVAGRVVSAAGAGVPGAVVRAGALTAAGPHVAADAEGRFTLRGLPPGMTWISLADGVGAQQVEIVPDATAQVEIIVPAQAVVSGRVTAGGRAVAGHIVNAGPGPAAVGGPYRAVTGEDGSFALGEVKPGHLRIGVTDPGGRFLHGEDLDVVHGEQRHVELVLADATLRVEVRAAEDARPIPDARLSYAAQRNINTRVIITDAQGVAVLDHLSGGSLWLRATAPGRLLAEMTVDVPPQGSARTVQLDLPRSAAIEGTVELADGGPMVALRVRATGPGDDVRFASVQPDGAFVLDQLPPGRWRLVVMQRVGGADGTWKELDSTDVETTAAEAATVKLMALPERAP